MNTLEVLREIAKPRVGLDGTETPAEQAEYWSKWALRYRAMAAKAIDKAILEQDVLGWTLQWYNEQGSPDLEDYELYESIEELNGHL